MILINTISYSKNRLGNTYKSVNVKCDLCGIIKNQPFYSYYKTNFHKCKKCSAIGRNHFNRKGKSPTNAKIKCLVSCDFCNKSRPPKTKRSLQIAPHTFCNSSCQVKWQNQNTSFNKGSNNPSFTHGERVNGKLANYGEGFNSKTRRDIKIRDGYNCQKCKLNFSGKLSGRLDVHHIDHDKYNNQLTNLVCLCKSCHTKVHWEDGKNG